eukprot:1147205-Pelagomonas_calceolata.AAC.2
MGFLLCAIDVHADNFKMRSMSSSSLGMRGVQAVSHFLLQLNKELFFFMSKLLDLLLAGADHSLWADQPSSLAEGLPM